MVQILVDFPFVTTKELIKIEPLTEELLSLATFIANTTEAYTELHKEIDEFIKQNGGNESHKSVVDFAKNINDTIKINLFVKNTLKTENIKAKIDSLDKNISTESKLCEIVKWIELQIVDKDKFNNIALKQYIQNMALVIIAKFA